MIVMKENTRLFRDITVFSVFVFIVLIFLGNILGKAGFSLDSILFIIITISLYFSRKTFSLSPAVFIMLEISMILHNTGVFGFYYASPLPIRWDIITHFTAIMSSSMAFFCFLEGYLGKKILSGKSLAIIFVAFLSALGIGSLIETAEFTGFSFLGFGEGGFMFGDGDLTVVNTDLPIEEQVEAYGGGWFNTMHDLISNSVGAFLGVSIMSFLHFRKKRRK